MRILVTGGAGFIGSHLCERLLAEGHDVICLDNYFTGSKDNIRTLMEHSRFEVIRHDIINYIDIESDQIYNLACPASPIHYQHDAIRTIHANVLGVTNMLELAKRTGARILQASTSEVYGDPKIHPQPETYWGNVNPIGIRSCYDEGKRVAETLMLDYHRQHGVDIRIARIFNTYGPRMAVEDGRVVSSFVVQALRGRPLTVFGRGEQTRSFCFVSDLVEGLVALMNRDEWNGPINLGNPEEFTIRELAGAVLELTGSGSPVVELPLPEDDPTRRRPDIALARRVLGWSPVVPLRDGLVPTIKHFRGVLQMRKSAGAGEGSLWRRMHPQLAERLAGPGAQPVNGARSGNGGGHTTTAGSAENGRRPGNGKKQLDEHRAGNGGQGAAGEAAM